MDNTKLEAKLAQYIEEKMTNMRENGMIDVKCSFTKPDEGFQVIPAMLQFANALAMLESGKLHSVDLGKLDF